MLKFRQEVLFLWAVLCWNIGAAANEPGKPWVEPLTGMEFVAIPKGCFVMGRKTPPELPWWTLRTPLHNVASIGRDEIPSHEVCVDAFWMSRHEVRMEDWKKLIGDRPGFSGDNPVTGISWHEAVEFAAALSAKQQPSIRFRLPTEAEWEYACRAGEKGTDSLTDEALAEQAWHGFPGPRQMRPHPVAQLRPNAFGLHDMLGNVWEWVQDSYQADGYRQHRLYNPLVELADQPRVIRGGSYRSEALNTRCGKRAHHEAGTGMPMIGFRLVRIAQ